jgi:cholesterol transport system auxiliary component
VKLRLFLIMSFVALSSCSLLGPQKTPTVTTYTLSISKIHTVPVHDHKITLLVNTPTAAAGYDSRKMIYTKRPYELSEFALNQWAAPPAEMLETILVQKLNDTGRFHAIISNAYSANRQFILRTHLIELRQNFTVKPSQIQLSLQAELINAQDSKVINTGTFATSVPAVQNTPYGGVLAANKAADRLLNQIAEFCLHSLNSH